MLLYISKSFQKEALVTDEIYTNGPIAVNGKATASGNLSNKDAQRQHRETQKENKELGNFPSTICKLVLSVQISIFSGSAMEHPLHPAEDLSCWRRQRPEDIPPHSAADLLPFSETLLHFHLPHSSSLYNEETRFSLCMIYWEQHYISTRRLLLIRKL